MSIRVHVEGKVCRPEDARIPVFDRGFLYGDSVYETIGTVHGQLYALDEHLDRLERSALGLRLRTPERSQIVAAVAATLQEAANAESRVRIIITRGAGKLDLDPGSLDSPALVVIVQPLEGPSPAMYREGVAVEIVARTRNGEQAVDPAIKSGNYLSSVLALGEARQRRPEAHEAILCSASGGLAEGASSNLFVVKAGQLRTPSLAVGILAGVTRAAVLTLARSLGVPVCELSPMPEEELTGADEAFLTSAARGILPVTRVNGMAIGGGRPGPVTLHLRQAYLDHVEASLRRPPPGLCHDGKPQIFRDSGGNLDRLGLLATDGAPAAQA